MDDEETIWKLDATALSGFAIQETPESEETGTVEGVRFICHSIEDVDVQVSQTLETHHFPYYLQISLATRLRSEPPATSSATISSASSTVSAAVSTSASTSSSSPALGVILLLPLNHILSILISDHSHHGQTLRIKLTDPNKRTERIRQSISPTGPGRMFGVNEPDPFDVLGMLKFREMSVKIAGVDGAWRQAVAGWTECMRRNAEKEWGHWFQILRENRDGRWEILESSDGGRTGVEGDMEVGALDGERQGKMELDVEDVEDDGMLRIPSVNISEGTYISDHPASEPDRDFTRRSSNYNLKSSKTLPPSFDKNEVPSRHPKSDLDKDPKFPDRTPRSQRDRSETPLSQDNSSVDSVERRERNSDETSPERYSRGTTRYGTRPQVKENSPDYDNRRDSDRPPKFLTGANKIPSHAYVENRMSLPRHAYFQNSPRRYNSTTRTSPPFRRHYNNYKPYGSSPLSDRYHNCYYPKRFSDPPPFNSYNSYSSSPPRNRLEHFKPYIPYRRQSYEPRFNEGGKCDDSKRRYDTGKAYNDRRHEDDGKRYDEKRHDEETRREGSRSPGDDVVVFPPRRENNASKKRIPQIERRE
jgi:hypothetical protein